MVGDIIVILLLVALGLAAAVGLAFVGLLIKEELDKLWHPKQKR